MNFYPRYLGDYQRDTSRLSIMEHGAYTLLLDDYYGQESPLPADISELWRICRASTKGEKEAVRRVAEMFFPIATDGLRHNGRADEEIELGRKRIAAAQENGKRGGRPAKTQQEPGGIPSNNPAGSNGETHWGTQHESSPSPSPETTTASSPNARAALLDLVCAANAGLAEHTSPELRVPIPRIHVGQPTAQAATAEILAHVPHADAKRILYDVAKNCRHDGRVSSLGFFVGAVKRAYGHEQSKGGSVDRSGKRRTRIDDGTYDAGGNDAALEKLERQRIN